MSDFTKVKIGFAIALLAALFTISPVTSNLGAFGFYVFGIHIEIKHLYYFISLFLTLAVYFYSIQFLTERQVRFVRFAQMLADGSYAIAIVAPILYLSLFLVVLLTAAISPIVKSENLQGIFQNVLSGIMGVLSVLASQRLMKLFAKREKQSSSEEYDKQAISVLDRAKQLFEDGHYDLSVIECFKSIETAARKVLLQKGVSLKNRSTRDLIQAAQDQGIIPEDRISLVHTIRQSRNIAAHGDKPSQKRKQCWYLKLQDVFSHLWLILRRMTINEEHTPAKNEESNGNGSI